MHKRTDTYVHTYIYIHTYAYIHTLHTYICALHAGYLRLLSEYAILIAFHGTNGYVNPPPCYVLRTYIAYIVQFPLVSSLLTPAGVAWSTDIN